MRNHPNLDAEMAAALAADPPPPTVLDGLPYEELAALRAERAARPVGPPVPGVVVTDQWLPGPTSLRVRTYRPRSAGSLALPCLVWVHGGGMVLGSPETDDARVSAYALEADCAVISVDYRLAPEHPYPAPVEDCYRALRWAADHAESLRIDPGRLAIGGISAGGGLAAATALLAKDSGGPGLIFQFLLCPMLDDRNTTGSSREFTEAVTWPRANNLYGWAALLGPLAGSDGVPSVRRARPGGRSVGAPSGVRRRRGAGGLPRRVRAVRAAPHRGGGVDRVPSVAGRVPRLRRRTPPPRTAAQGRPRADRGAAPGAGRGSSAARIRFGRARPRGLSAGRRLGGIAGQVTALVFVRSRG